MGRGAASSVVLAIRRIVNAWPAIIPTGASTVAEISEEVFDALMEWERAAQEGSMADRQATRDALLEALDEWRAGLAEQHLGLGPKKRLIDGRDDA